MPTEGAMSNERLEWLRRDDRVKRRNIWRYWRIEQLSMELWFALRAKDYTEADRAKKLLNAYGVEVSQYKDKLPWDSSINIVVGKTIETAQWFDEEYDAHGPSKSVWDAGIVFKNYPTPLWSKERFWYKHHPSFVPSWRSATFEITPGAWRKMADDMRRTCMTKAKWWARHYEAIANAIERDPSWFPEPDSEWLLGGS